MSNKRKIRQAGADLNDPVRAKVAALAGSAHVAETTPVDLPVLGITVHLRSINRTEAMKVGTYAMGGDVDDIEGRGFVGVLRWMLVDDKGRHLIESYTGAANFVANLDEDDFKELFVVVGELNAHLNDDGDDEDDDEESDGAPPVGEVEAGKSS